MYNMHIIKKPASCQKIITKNLISKLNGKFK